MLSIRIFIGHFHLECKHEYLYKCEEVDGEKIIIQISADDKPTRLPCIRIHIDDDKYHRHIETIEYQLNYYGCPSEISMNEKRVGTLYLTDIEFASPQNKFRIESSLPIPGPGSEQRMSIRCLPKAEYRIVVSGCKFQLTEWHRK